MRKIDLFDTTLRDGEQSLEATMDSSQKLEIARQLVRLGVDVIEVGFPASSPNDFQSVRRISQEIRGAIVCGLARCVQRDIDLCADAMLGSKNTRINIGLAISPIHMDKKLGLRPDQVVEKAVWAVKYAGKTFHEVQFFLEDALRGQFDFLVWIMESVIKAGATVVTISDTVGVGMPWKYGELIRKLKETVQHIERVKLSVHCHNDLGLATANAITALLAGADQVEGTINGIGERAGNASLEEIIMALYLEQNDSGITTGAEIRQIYETSKTVSRITGIPLPRYKAVVGTNMFSHASGIHQDGIIKEKLTYEPFDPQIIGAPAGKIVLTARSGRNALKHKLKELGYEYCQAELDQIYSIFIRMADKKKRTFNEHDLIRLVTLS
ncbi:MAG: 2-isopropylmalate synthase [Dehalobacter sp. 4CP]|uniref:2-isopropylmalate synthase n=1 Tax=Dehalobacter sp. CP TaxID=2594474 RepID=UPI0013CC59A3|nr:2-isopropylmalate synthase [Dehalobacter sp.]NBJ15955.1 2-isopropylmalate synthase [Dehalobacter sp. 4CP]